MHRQAYHMLSANRHASTELDSFRVFNVNMLIPGNESSKRYQSINQALKCCLQILKCNVFGAVQSSSIKAAANLVLTMQVRRAGIQCHALAAVSWKVSIKI